MAAPLAPELRGERQMSTMALACASLSAGAYLSSGSASSRSRTLVSTHVGRHLAYSQQRVVHDAVICSKEELRSLIALRT